MTADDIKGGIPLETVETTQVDILPGQAALIMYEDGVTLVIPESDDEEAFVPQHVMFLIGVYFRSESPEFVEKTIRIAIDRLKQAQKMDD